ncbi:MAG: precorrin-2 C(20)-methyltransferase [Desulfobacterota bacterium]|nr:precorrin-2 C(20)-methyltransferase [Thermodesulfobacteriota bacterium]MDW8001281.1 precorrin-2 C(20)-methyltransferase [Deltaproteobacteria bacterium]
MKKKSFGKLFGVGIGPGDWELLTLKALRILKEVDVIFCPKGDEKGSSIARSIVERLVDSSKEFVDLVFPMTKDKEVLRNYWEGAAKRIFSEIEKGKNCAFITLGDPLIYSTYIYLLKTLRNLYPTMEIETVPGVSAINAASAKAEIPLLQGDESMAIVPSNAKPKVFEYALKNFETVVIMKIGSKLENVLQRLKKMGLLDKAYLITRVGQDGERVIHGLSGLKKVGKEGYMSIIVVRKD